MMLTFASPHALSVSAEDSLDSSDGQNGLWSPLFPVLINPLETATRLQRLDLDPGVSRWIRLHLTNASGGSLSVTNIGMYAIDAAGKNDYWLFIGASIQQGSARHSEFKANVTSRWGYDPVLFNEGYNGWMSSTLRQNLNSILARHPNATYVAVHIGGNDVTAYRPYPGGAGQMYTNIVNILQTIINSNMIPVPARLSFRAYNSDPVVDTIGNPLSETNGSGPYVTAIHDPLILHYAPDFYDSVHQRGSVDMYSYFLEHQSEISSDGIHLNETGKQSWNRLWSEWAGAHVYDDLVPPALSGAISLNATNVLVAFSEDVDLVSAETAAHYEIHPDVIVHSATRGPLDHLVTLVTSPLTNAALYTLTVNQVMDPASNTIAVASTATFTYVDPSIPVSILFDLGTSSFLTTGNWNNVTQASTGKRVTNAVASNGSATMIGLEILDAFVGSNPSGIATNLVYPSEAQRDTFYISGTGDTQAVIRITGLFTNVRYDLSFFASRTASGDTNRSAIYRAGVDFAMLNAADNQSNRASIASVQPNASGHIDITVQAAPGQSFGYLGVLEIGFTLAPPENIDSDSDGIPDWWEMLHSGNPTNLSAIADDDMDHMDNRSEWIANTDPTNAASAFILTDFSVPPGSSNHPVLTWNSASGRVYSILGTTNLLMPMFIIASNLPATTPLNVYTITVNESSADVFHSLRVHVP